MNGIVYTSNTGYTQRYAQMLSERIGLPNYRLREEDKVLQKGEAVIYLGWLRANEIVGYAKAAGRYDVQAVGAIGLSPFTEAEVEKLAEKNQLQPGRLFYMQGGLDINKLSGVYKALMKMMRSTMHKALQDQGEKNEEERARMQALINGGDFVSPANLESLIRWYQNR